MTSVSTLRRKLKRHRRALPAHQRHTMNRELCRNILKSPTYRNARSIALYLPFGGEPNLMPVIQDGVKTGKQILLPRVHGPNPCLQFLRWQPGQALIRNRFGIPEPSLRAPELPSHGIDLVLLPLVGFDQHGNRIGMGAGYYDRTFGFRLHRRHWLGPKLLGTAWSFQRCEVIHPEPWDVPVDGIVTESDWIQASQN